MRSSATMKFPMTCSEHNKNNRHLCLAIICALINAPKMLITCTWINAYMMQMDKCLLYAHGLMPKNAYLMHIYAV